MTSERREIRVAFNDSDREFWNQFVKETDLLAGLVVDMVESNPASLLSPIFRGLLLDQAKKVFARLKPIATYAVFIDNPGKPLEVMKP